MHRWRAVVALGLGLSLVFGGCTSSHSATSATTSGSSSSTTGLSHRAFADALASGDKAAMNDIFAPDAQFFTPVLAQPIVGHDHVVKLVAVLIDTFQERHVVAELDTPDRFGLAFDAHVGDQEIHIFDLLSFNASGQVTVFVSHGRPLAGVQALSNAVAPHIPEILR
jgi:hypothetical protein